MFIEDDEKFHFCLGVVIDDDYEDIRALIDNDEIDKALERLRKLWNEREPRGQRTSPEEVDLRVGLARIQAAWRQPFLGPNLTILEEIIKEQSNEFDGKTPPYAKVMPIVQSSGAGKSRLVDHFAAHHLGVIYTFRLKDQSGYPPGDTIITSLMRESLKKLPTTRRTMEHATAVALLGATCIESKLNQQL